MSLYKQLWIAIAVLMLIVFSVTFAINGISSSRYLEQQLSLKNADDATRIALSLSQQEFDPILLELQLAAQVDQGSYEYIEFRDPSGKVTFNHSNTLTNNNSLNWLHDLFPIHSLPGVAEVTNGWNQLGSLTLKSHENFVYNELWNNAKRTLLALVLAIIIAGALGAKLLQVILNPLKQVVNQARAIDQRRFISLPEPFTTEFAEVTRSMNELARRIKEMLNRESQRLAHQREISEFDPNTGILQREPFMGHLRAKLESESADATGSVALVRFANLSRMNQLFGRQSMDNVLKAIGSGLHQLTVTEVNWVTGRLNGSDFCLISPQEADPKQTAETLQSIIKNALREHSIADKVLLPTACVEYASGDTVSDVMTRLDGALLASDEENNSTITLANRSGRTITPVRQQAITWKVELDTALKDNCLFIETFPVRDVHGGLIHDEGMLRIRTKDKVCHAGEFMPWVHRLDLGGKIDRTVLLLAMKHIAQTSKFTCANLTASCLKDTTFITWFEAFLIEHSEHAEKLSIEVNEAAAYTHSNSFHRLSQQARALNVKIGIEHMGYRISDIGKLSELGVDYLKIDGLFVRDIKANAGNTALFRTYANIAQSMGIICIAEGVSSESEMSTVFELGASGACGKAIK